jgi:peroxiredoxin Q/BCP
MGRSEAPKSPAGSLAAMPELQPGDDAPGFTLLDQAGEPVSLADFRGRKVLLYFFPKADTPG